MTESQINEINVLILGLKKNKDFILSRVQQNIVKKTGYETVDKKGNWNGYGYEKLGKIVLFKDDNNLSNLLILLKKEVKKSSNLPLKKSPIKKTEADKVNDWINRLSKLTGISISESTEIAKEKEEYKLLKIDEVEEKQSINYSKQRTVLINKMKRENPLRPIKDKEHAENILKASNRHNSTNYEQMLNVGREKALSGEIDKSEVKDYARKNMFEKGGGIIKNNGWGINLDW